MASHDNIDWAFIGGNEGGQSLRGYLPLSMAFKGKLAYFGDWEPNATLLTAIKGKSGVTIATGFDIGQHNEWELRQRLKLPMPLADKLVPFVSPLQRGDAAKKLYQLKGLTITKPDADTIDVAVKRTQIRHLISNYNGALPANAVVFELLPAGIETAIASFAFQYGDNFGARMEPLPKQFWQVIIAQNWMTAAEVLEAGMDAYPQRRRAEATLIRQALAQLPSRPK